MGIMRITKLGMAAALAAVALGSAARGELNIGDKAPALSIMDWVKGSPIDLAKDVKRKIHVVEFWAVWCPPCKMSVPLLTELQKKYRRDLVIVGVTEPDAGRNTPSAIRRFVKEQGSNMGYTVAIDTGKTVEAYMMAAGAVGIPHAFVVARDGRIAWQGSPLDPALETAIEGLIKGTFDLAGAKIEQEVNKRFEQLDLMLQLGQWQKVWDGLVEILRMDPANEMAVDVLVRVSIGELGNLDQLRSWARAHIDAHRGNAKAMNRLSRTLWSIADLQSRFPDLALEAAKAAYDASGKREATAIAAYAHALYQIGDLDRAIALQQDAVAVAIPDQREGIRAALDYYRKCKDLQATVR